MNDPVLARFHRHMEKAAVDFFNTETGDEPQVETHASSTNHSDLSLRSRNMNFRVTVCMIVWDDRGH